MSLLRRSLAFSLHWCSLHGAKWIPPWLIHTVTKNKFWCYCVASDWCQQDSTGTAFPSAEPGVGGSCDNGSNDGISDNVPTTTPTATIFLQQLWLELCVKQKKGKLSRLEPKEHLPLTVGVPSNNVTGPHEIFHLFCCINILFVRSSVFISGTVWDGRHCILCLWDL